MRASVAIVALAAMIGCSNGAQPVRAAAFKNLPADEEGTASCDGLAVEWNSSGLTARDGDEVVLELATEDDFEQLIPLWCGDLTGDGKTELGTQHSTGGAHCCNTVRVDTLRGPTLLDADLGNAGDPDPSQLDDSVALELATFSDVLAYFDEIPYVAPPALPRVFAFREGRYVDATTDFTDYIRGSLADAQKNLDKTVAGDDTEAIKGMALGVFGHYVLLGDDSGLEEVAGQVPDEVAQWLRDHADEAIELIRKPA